MALSLTEISAYTHNLIVPRTTDTIFKNSAPFTRLHNKNMERFNGGIQIVRPIIIGELNGDAVGRGEGMDINFVVTDTALVLNMKLYYVAIALYGFDSMQNDGPEAVFSQVELKFQNAAMKMAKLLATNMYLSAQDAGRSKHLNGFSEIYDDGNAYPSYGGITRSDVMAVGTIGGLNASTKTITSFSLNAVNASYGDAWFGADHPDMIACTQNGWNLFWNALQPLSRYNDDRSSDIAQAGFNSFRFNAADVVVDKYMPTGTNGVMYLMNTNYIEWFFSTNKRFQFGFTGFKEAANTIDVAGQFLVGSQLVGPNPRSGAKILSNLF